MRRAELLVPALIEAPYAAGEVVDASAPLVWTVHDLLSHDECRALIQRIEAAGPESAPISTARGFEMRPDIRNNTRVIFDDVPLANELFLRVQPALPARVRGQVAVGVNERFRCYRYDVGQQFAPHYDGAFQRSTNEASLLTFMVYLNEGFSGGSTIFHQFGVEVVPRTGRALLFQHRLLHEGARVLAGVKYALRTDVMYRTTSA